MANIIDIVVGKQAQAEVDKLIASLKLTHEEIIKINQQGLKINSGASPKNPVQMNASVKETISLTEKLDVTTKKLTDTEKKLQQERLKELQIQKQREVAVDKYNAQLDKESAKLANASNMYNRLQAELTKLNNAYSNLAVRQAQGAQLTKVEIEQKTYLANRIKNVDTTMKAVDASMGKYQRNVGNYASGFNPLSNSINQLGREMPAFANSVQTGFMAISNNLPIFFDAMGQVIAQNKELQAQGKPTKSVLSQLASSLFSFQTLLSVGVTLLTVYGKEIVAWASSLMGASEALDELDKSQKEFNKSRAQGRKDAVSEISLLKQYVSTLRDSNVPMLEREIALKKLRSQYPGYFKDLKDEELLNGNIFGSLNQLNTALEKRKTLELATDYNVKNKQKFQDLDNERKTLIQSIPFLEKQLEINKELAKNDARQFSGLVSDAENKLNKAKERRVKVDEEILTYAKAISANDAVINQYKKETILLEYQEDKQREKKKKDLKELADLNIEQADFLAREFELRKKVYENSIEANKAIFDDEKNTLTERLYAYQLYMNLKEQLVKAEYVEQNRVIDEEYKNQTESINQAYNDQIKAINKGVIDGGAKRIQAETEKNEAIKALEKKYYIDRSINYEDFEKAQKSIRDEYSKEIELATIERFAKIDKANEMALSKLNALKNRGFDAGTLTKETPLSSFKKYYDSKGKIEEDARIESLNRDLAYNETKLQNLTLNGKTESEEYKKLTSEKIALELQLQDIKDANTEREIKKLEEYKKLLEDTYKGFIDDFGSNSGFGKLLDIFGGGLDKFKGDAVATALAVSEAFQEAFNTISESSQANFDAEYNRLSMQKEIALQFAGESATAKEEIDRQYEERRKSIARREAEAAKRLAIFNIAINTAQAIVGALATLPSPAAVPTSIAVGIIGAAQIALVASQQIPQFWKGTDNAPEGLAWTQEKGAEVITDKKGNVKTLGNNKGAQLTYLEQGDKVYKSRQDYINKTLVNAGIQPMRGAMENFERNNSLTTTDFNAGISKLAKTMQSNRGSNTQVFLNNKIIDTDSLRGKGQKV